MSEEARMRARVLTVADDARLRGLVLRYALCVTLEPGMPDALLLGVEATSGEIGATNRANVERIAAVINESAELRASLAEARRALDTRDYELGVQDGEIEEACPHETWRRDYAAVEDGMCPLCLAAALAEARRRAEIAEVDTRQLEAVDAALPEWKGTGRGRVETISRLRDELAEARRALGRPAPDGEKGR